MPDRRTLTAEEETRCITFLRSLRIQDPDHRILSNRGFFSLFLSGLRPEEIGDTLHPDIRQFRETIRLLAIAGTDRLRELLRTAQAERNVSPPPQLPTSVHRPAPSADPPTGTSTRPPSGSSSATPLPDPPTSSPDKPRRQFKRDINFEPPPEHARERMRHLEHAQTSQEAIEIAQRYAAEEKFHDAHHILIDYQVEHPLDENLLTTIAKIILDASNFDRDKSIPPVNMLFECEELAAVLARKMPDLNALARSDDERTRRLYGCVELVYRVWTTHCTALLEYKYRMNNRQYVLRNWIDPRDFGFLSEIMRMAIRARLPLDLLRFVYARIKECIAIGKTVIAHDDKRSRFEGDMLRIIASPTKDVIPDLTFDIFREIVNAYIDEGDSQNAIIFCKQALLIHRNDRELLTLKSQLLEMGNSPSKAAVKKLKTTQL